MSLIHHLLRPAAIPWALRLLYGAWAAFWTWFVVMVSTGESPAPPWWIPTLWIASLLGLGIATWKWSAVGGVLLTVAGAASWLFFPNSAARAMLSVPAMVIGVGFAAYGIWRPHPPLG